MKFFSSFFVLLLITFMPLLAQEENTGMPVTKLPDLDDEFLNWMVGTWEGNTVSEMGKTKDVMKCELGTGNQFLIMNYTSVAENMPEFTGVAVITKDAEGKYKGFWYDSWRSMTTGSGTGEGNKSTMTWQTPSGKYVRTTERIDDNTIHITGVMTGPDGKEKISEAELKRIK